MNCPNCGAESTYGLNYCKRCGNYLIQQPASQEIRLDPARLSGLFWSVAVLTVGGLAVLFGSAIAMVALNASSKIVVALSLFGSGALVVIASLLIQQLSRLVSLSENQQRPAIIQKANVAPPLVDAPPRSASSVTEHTTRNFDPASYKQAE